MSSAAPFKVLVAGGGPAGLEAVLALRDIAPELDVDLIAPEARFVYRPLSVVEPFARGTVRSYPLAALEDVGATVHRDAVLRVDPDERTVATEDRHELPYDALLIATGAHNRRAIPRVLTFEGPAYVEAMHGLIQDIEAGYTRSVGFVAPAGAGWTLPLYELALQTAERARSDAPDDVQITFVSHERRPLELLGDEAIVLAERLLAEAGIAFETGAEPPRADRTVVLPVPAGRRTPGLPVDASGFLPVDEHGRVEGVPGVWGAGDGTNRPIKQGGLATQQGEVAARSIAAAAGLPVETPPYRPELRAMLVTGRGAYYLGVPSAGAPVEVSDRPLWSPPTKVAGERLAPFLDALDAATPRSDRFERRLADRLHRTPGGR
jgi:sulfide:quinone oxidoreductase